MSIALTFQDLPDVLQVAQDAAPPGWTVQRIDGLVCMSPRPRNLHQAGALALTVWASNRFDERNPDRRGPGGWHFLTEPEWRTGDDVLVPDLAGWRVVERMPVIPDEASVKIAPDWVCEVLSPSTARFDRGVKLPAFAAHGVSWAWLFDLGKRRMEAFRLEGDTMLPCGVLGVGAPGRLDPFGATELRLEALLA